MSALFKKSSNGCVFRIGWYRPQPPICRSPELSHQLCASVLREMRAQHHLAFESMRKNSSWASAARSTHKSRTSLAKENAHRLHSYGFAASRPSPALSRRLGPDQTMHGVSALARRTRNRAKTRPHARPQRRKGFHCPDDRAERAADSYDAMSSVKTNHAPVWLGDTAWSVRSRFLSFGGGGAAFRRSCSIRSLTLAVRTIVTLRCL